MDSSPVKKKIVLNTVYSGLSSLVTGLIGFLLIPFMIARVGVTEFGLVGISNIFAMSGYISLLEMGFQSSIAVYIAEFYSKKEEHKILQLLNTTLVLFFVIGTLLMLLGMGLSDIFIQYVLQIPDAYQDSFKTALLLIFVSYIFQFPTIAFAGLFQGLQRFDLLKGVQTATVILAALGIIFLLSLGYNYLAIIVCTVLSLFIQFFLYLYFAYRKLPFFMISYEHFSRDIISTIWKMSKFLSIGNIASVIHLHTPRIIVGIFLGPVFMASFDVIVKLPRFIKSQLGFLNSAVMSAASELKVHAQYGTLRELFIRGLRYQFVIALPIITCSIFFAEEFLRAWVGRSFENLASLLQLALLWNFMTPIVNYGGSILVGMNRKLERITILHVMTAILGIIISVILAQRYKLNGIIIGYVLSYMLTLPWYLSMYLREFDIKYPNFLKETVPMFICVVLPLIVVIFVNHSIQGETVSLLIMKAFVWCFVYWGVLYFIALNKEDRRMVLKLLPLFSKS